MKKAIIKFSLIILFIIIIIATVVILNGYKLYKTTIESLSIENKIAEIKKDKDYVSYSDVPDYYINAIIAVEDHRYREHKALDIISLGRAIVVNIQSNGLNEGGSTITQQVAKNLFFISEDDFVSRKIAEFFVANELEQKYSKDEILEFYINTIYFGQSCYGIKEASNYYYDKDPKDLTLYEATLLAGVPNAPSLYNPVDGAELAKDRQKKVVHDMVQYGYLTQKEADNILKENEE